MSDVTHKKYLVVYDKDFCVKYGIFNRFKVVSVEGLRKLRLEPMVIPVEYGSWCDEDIIEFDDVAKFLEISDEEISVLEKFEIIK